MDFTDADDDSSRREAGEDQPNPPPPGANAKEFQNQSSTTRSSPRSSTRSSRPSDLCPPEELDQLRALLDKQLENLAGAVARLANKLQRAPDGAAEPQLGFRPRGRPARHRAPHPRRDRSAAGAELQGRARHRFPRHRGDAPARQFRLDARPPDHHRGDLRRHPRPHPRALRREGRDPRLHHPRLEGRQSARGLARGGASAESGPRQRHPPHHLQGGRRALAACPAQSRPDDARGPAQGKYRRRGPAMGAQAPAGADRKSPHPDGDFRRRASRRFDPERECRQLPRGSFAPGHRRDRDPLRRCSWSPSASATT